MSCIAYAQVEAPSSCAELEIAARLGQRWPAIGVARRFELPRMRAGGVLAEGPLAGRVGMAAVRSGGEQGYVGIDGESIVLRLEVAEVIGTWPIGSASLQAAAGLVADPWVAGGESAWALPSVAAAWPLSTGLMERSDLGARVALRSPMFGIEATATSGEGLRYRERNDGKDLGIVVGVQPVEALRVELFARQGSRGLDPARDHRVAARVSANTASVHGGVEVMAAWGVDGDPLLTPRGGSAWVWATPGWVVVYGRADQVSWIPGDREAIQRELRAGGGVGVAPGRLLAGVERGWMGADAAPIAGGEALARWTGAFVQAEVDLVRR